MTTREPSLARRPSERTARMNQFQGSGTTSRPLVAQQILQLRARLDLA